MALLSMFCHLKAFCKQTWEGNEGNSQGREWVCNTQHYLLIMVLMLQQCLGVQQS